MIADFANEATETPAEFQEHVEGKVSTIALDHKYEFIHHAHRDFAQNKAEGYNQRRLRRLEDELQDGQDILEAEKVLTRPGELSRWKQTLNCTATEIRRSRNLALTFGDMAIEKVIAIASATNIYALCSPVFSWVVTMLKHLGIQSADMIRQLIKQARPPRKPKEVQPIDEPESSVEWERDPSGGGRHLVVNLYEDELATRIKREAEEKQITEQQVIKQAFCRKWEAEEVEKEFTDTMNQVREKDIERQRIIIRQKETIQEKDEIIQQQQKLIEELQASKEGLLTELPATLEVSKENNSALAVIPTIEDQVKKQKPVIYIGDFTNWTELAEAVNQESDKLMAVAKLASEEERSHFAQILAEFCEKDPKALDCIDWVIPKLRDAALGLLDFSVQRLADTCLADDPIMETMQGCKFVAVRDLGGSAERWVFQLPNKKNIPVSDRTQFWIEKF